MASFGRGRLMDILEASRKEDTNRPGNHGPSPSYSSESQRNGYRDGQASYASNENRNNSNSQYGQGDSRSMMHQNNNGPARNCYNCGQPGHTSRDCRTGQQNSRPGGYASNELASDFSKSMVFTATKPNQGYSGQGSNGGGNYVNGSMQRMGGGAPGGDAPGGGGAPGGGARGCFNCGEEGHGSRDCPQSSRPSGGGGVNGGSNQIRSCYNCGKDGHTSNNCPEPRKERGPRYDHVDSNRERNDDGMRNNARGCYSCGRDGHSSRDCPEPRKERSNDNSRPPRACFNCGNESHNSRDCPEPRKERSNDNSRPPRACFNCGNESHNSRDCPEPRKERSNDNLRPPRGCFNCGNESHNSRECPEPRKENSRPPRACFNCGNESHNSRDCPEPRKENNSRPSRACFNCGKDGHNFRDCPEPRKERSNDDSRPPRACYNCGKDGHNSRDCPEPRKERSNDDSRPPRGCYNCGKDGHNSRDCPEPRKERTWGTYYRCEQEGHMAKDCPKASTQDDGKPRPPPYIPPPPPENEEDIFSTITQGINFNRYDEIKVECTGQNIPSRPMESFTDVNFSDVIMTNLRKTKYEKPTPIQKWSIPVIISGRDMMGCAQTGSGKTASFLLPMLTKMLGTGFEPPIVEDGCAMPLMLVMAPTRELVLQIFHETRKFSFDTVVRAVVAYGGVSSSHQEKDILKGAHIVIATPGRLIDFIGKKKINLSKLKYLVLDEVDRMLDMGFHTAIESILSQGESGMPSTNSRQTVVFSATIPEEVQKLAAKLLREDYIFVTVGSVGSANLDIEQYVLLMEQEAKRDKLMEIVQNRGDDKIIIFVEEKRKADFISAFLSQASFPTASIHGNLTQAEREKSLRDFRGGVSPILVATNVAARGLDIPEVKHVINYDMPQHIEEYVHRIGRTGRCGNTGKATAFFVAENDNHLARSLVKVLSDAMQEVPEWLEKLAVDNIGMGGFSRPGGGKFGGRDMRSNRPMGYQQQSGPSHYQGDGGYKGDGGSRVRPEAAAARTQPAAKAASPAANEDEDWD